MSVSSVHLIFLYSPGGTNCRLYENYNIKNINLLVISIGREKDLIFISCIPT